MRTNPYYASVMRERGENITDLEIVKDFFIPTEQDIKRITGVLADCDTIIDIGSGYGLLLNSIAKNNPGKRFLGIDTMYWDKNFKRPIAEKNVRFKFTGIEAIACERFNNNIKKYDCVLCCWMPEGSDWRELFSKIAKKKVILILSKYFATVTPETYIGMEVFGYNFEESWCSGESVIQIWKKIKIRLAEINCSKCGSKLQKGNMKLGSYEIPVLDCSKCSSRYITEKNAMAIKKKVMKR